MSSTKNTLLAAVSALFLAMPLAQAATEAQAQMITGEFDRAYLLWQSDMKLAKSSGSVQHVAHKRPDATEHASKLKVLISRDLAKDWTLDYGAWLLENDSALKPESQRALLKSVEEYHTLSPKVGRFCMGMIYLNQRGEMPRAGQPPIRSRGMALLKTIKKNNPDPKVQGQAALALSMMLSSLGDDTRVMKERISSLREAIIKSSEVKVGSLTVAEIATDELYKINHLSKGRPAPAIMGNDSSGRLMQLNQFKGKVVMLVFWSSWDAEAGRMLELLKKTSQSNVGKPFALLGVNRDSLKNLRSMEADGLVNWRNFSDPNQKIAESYRVATWPYCIVLDQQGVIQYHGNIGAFSDAVANDLLNTK